MKITIAPTALALSLALSSSPAFANNEKTWDTASSIGVYSLIAASVGYPLVTGDTNGALQAGGSVAAAEAAAYGLKKAFPEWRPDHSDRQSFPSGHTSGAFAAATSIFIREGDGAGIPALAVATFVGLARVKADKHHWYDVVAGAAIGTGSGFLITRSRNRQVAMIPWGDTKSGGVTVAMNF